MVRVKISDTLPFLSEKLKNLRAAFLGKLRKLTNSRFYKLCANYVDIKYHFRGLFKH